MQNSNIAFRSIPELISEAREKHPSAVALSHGGRTVSYDSLDKDATRFASHLLAGGLPVSATVAICMERSIDWIVAALGIMRAGAAYVPLDPGWPEARILFALNDSAASVLVARSNLLERLGTQTFGIDPLRDRSAIAAASTTKIPSVSPEDLAYVIYTSGSSGVPKGVEISHANLAHLVRWHQKAFSVTPRERASHLAGLGFDAAVWEIWPNLCAGAALYLPTDEERSSAALMQQWLIREQINIAFVPTIHAAPMMGFKWPPSTSLRLLLTGGDVLSTNPPLNLPFRVINNYGPTECTVVATSTVLQPGSVGIPPIGKPIYGADIYLLDENGQRAADGTVAEIYIGGDGVGRSYRNLPEETKARFLADPFSDKPSARMYRTGDRGIRWPDGQIEFRGRLDRQIKIRGQRVELDEIASSLMNHPGVAFATVTTSTTNTGDIILLAYVLPTAETPALSRLELQEFLLETMPDYMVPAAFVRLEEVPVSINGKLDLSNLPQPSIANQLERVISKGIATPLEDRLLRIVRELLENESITAQENFFLAGGHSLLGMQLVMRITNALDVDLTLRQLFEAPTAASLAVTVGKLLDEKRLTAIWTELLRQKSIEPGQTFFDLGATQALMPSLQKRIAAEFGQRIPVEQLIESPTIHGQVELIRGFSEKRPTLPSGVVALQPHGTRDNIFWVHYLSVSLAKVVGEDQPFLSVMLTSEDFPRLGTSPTLAEIAACLVDKVLATQPEGPYTLGGFCLGGILAYEMASQLRASGHNVALLILLDTPNPSFLDSRYPLTPRMTDAAYLMKRVGQLGIRKSLLKVRSRILGGLKSSTPQTEPAIAQEMIETAASLYSPGKYEGDVLLLLASDRPAHVDFLPGWRAVVPNTLHAHYIDAHHDDLTKALNVRSVADAIRSYVLMSAETPPPAESPVSAQEDSEVIDSPITS